MMKERTRPILFFREGMFYPTMYPTDYSDWAGAAAMNPGTLKIEDGVTGEVLWLPQESA